MNHFFPSKEALERFCEKLQPVREQLIAMGAKVEVNDGPVRGFKVVGNMTLDMLSNGCRKPKPIANSISIQETMLWQGSIFNSHCSQLSIPR